MSILSIQDAFFILKFILKSLFCDIFVLLLINVSYYINKIILNFKNMNNLDEINKLIEDSGIKRKVVASKIGMTPSYLSSVLNGHRNLTVHVSKRILDLLKNHN